MPRSRRLPNLARPRVTTRAGAAAERGRLQAIDDLAIDGHDDLVAKAKTDGWSAADTATAILKAEKTLRASELAGIKGVEADTGKVPAAPAAGDLGGGKKDDKPAAAKTDDELKADFAASPKLQAEFADVMDYCAIVRAEAAGKVRVLGQPAAA